MRFDQSSPVQPNSEKKNLKKSLFLNKKYIFEEKNKVHQKQCYTLSFSILGGPDSTRALQYSPFQNSGGRGPLNMAEFERTNGRWKKSGCDLCKLFRRGETTNHVLNGCPVGLDQGRYTYRHNSVINYIVNSVDSKFKAYSDLPGQLAPGGGSIPPEICVTAEKPDIVIFNNHKRFICLSLPAPVNST